MLTWRLLAGVISKAVGMSWGRIKFRMSDWKDLLGPGVPADAQFLLDSLDLPFQIEMSGLITRLSDGSFTELEGPEIAFFGRTDELLLWVWRRRWGQRHRVD